MDDKIIVKVVGHGTAASNIDPMGNKLNILVHGWSSMTDGDVETSVEILESSTKDDRGVTTADKIQATEVIHATWMPSGSNRLTAPNIRVGERVEVLQETDRSVYYWRPMGLDEHQRKLETVIWGISASPNGGDDQFDPDNRYWIEFSSHSKKIVLTTSMANGEAARYSMSFDTGDGIFNLMDDRGNFATLESVNDNWKIGTSQGSFVEIDSEDINIHAENDLTVTVNNNAKLDVGNDISVHSGNSTSLEAGSSVDIKASTTANVEGGSSTTIKGGASTMNFNDGGISWSAATFSGN